MDIESVCTHSQLDDELKNKLDRLLPPSFSGDSTVIRTKALERVLKYLARRTPPIREGDISSPSELRDAVLYCAAEELYREAITSPDSVHVIQWRAYRDRANDELTSMNPTLSDGQRGASFSWSSERR